jgi:hypothetical protein
MTVVKVVVYCILGGYYCNFATIAVVTAAVTWSINFINLALLVMLLNLEVY